MATDKLVLRTITSPYSDETRGSVLAHRDVDENFIFLKGQDILSGLTVNSTLVLQRFNGSNILINLSGLPSGTGFTGTYVTGGTYSNGTATFTNSTGGTFNVTGFTTASTSSAIYLTGGTYSNGTATFTNSTGGTFNVTGFYTGSTDTFVTGGTYSNGTTIFRNNTGGTFSVSGFSTGSTSVVVTGGTYSNGTTTFVNSTGGTFSVSGFSTASTFTGLSTLDTTTIDLEGSGTTASALTASVILSSQNNAILRLNDGLFAPNTIKNGLVYGGIVTWVSNYTYEITSAGYYINSVFYTSPAYTVAGGNAITLTSPDPSFNRIDVFYVSTASTAAVLIGMPSSTPEKPSVNTSQIELSFALVETGSVSPTISVEQIYLNNVGEPTEWSATTNASGRINVNSSVIPITGLKNVEATNSIIGDTITFTNNTSLVVMNNLTVLTFKIQPKSFSGNIANRLRLRLGFRLGSTLIGTYLNLNNGSFGYDVTSVTVQTISLPISSFGVSISSLVDNLIIENVSTNNATYGFFIGDVKLQGVPVTDPVKISDTYVTGGTFTSGTLTFKNNSGGTFSITGIASSDTYITGGTYTAGTTTFRNNTGGTFSVTGFSTGTTTPNLQQVTDVGNTTTNPITVANLIKIHNGRTNEATSIGIGDRTLEAITTATGNIAIGRNALKSATTSNSNIVIGYNSMSGLTTGVGYNVVIGSTSLTGNTSGNQNVVLGSLSLLRNTTGSFNVAIGIGVMSANDSGVRNVAIGSTALNSNVTGSDNTAVGVNALRVATGGDNTALGMDAGFGTTTGTDNVFLGKNTKFANDGSFNTIIGRSAGHASIGSSNVFLGYNAGYNSVGDNKLYIANTSTATPLIYGDFTAGTVGINVVATNTLHVVGGGSPLRVEGLTGASDANVVTVDTNGVFHTYPIASIGSGGTANTFTTASTYNNLTGTITATRNDSVSYTTTGFNYVTGGTYSNNLLSLRTNTGATITINISDVFVTGGTYTAGTTTFVNNTGGTFSITGFSTGGTGTDIYTTASTYNNLTGIVTFNRNDNQTYTITGFNYVTGGTYAGNILSLRTNTGATIAINITDVFVTGGTYTAGTTTFVNNTGGTFSVTGFSTGGTVNTFTTASTYNNLTGNLISTRNDAVSYTATGFNYVTGGTYAGNILNLRTNTGGTVSINIADVFVTGGTYTAGTATFTNNTGGTFSVSGFSTGGTSSSGTEVYVTGGTYTAGTATFTNNTGGTFSVTGFSTGGTSSSATTLYTGNGSLISNRVVDINTSTLHFSSSTRPNNLVISGGSVGIGKNPSYTLDVDGVINFPNTTGSTYGVINQNGVRLIHRYGDESLFFGSGSGNFTNTGSLNVTLGHGSMSGLTSGARNIVIGYEAGAKMTDGANNVALGTFALRANTSGFGNIAIGSNALPVSQGDRNIGIGSNALLTNNNGSSNVSIGDAAMSTNASGSFNVAIGRDSMNRNTSGGQNVAVGYFSLYNNTIGIQNTGVGNGALGTNTSGSSNTGIGYQAGNNSSITGSNNTYIGAQAGFINSTGSSNVCIGYNAGYFETGSNKLHIAHSGNTSLIYGDFVRGIVGINTWSGATNALHVSAATGTAPMRVVGLTGASDANVVTVDTNGVFHTYPIASIGGGGTPNTFTTASTYNNLTGVITATRNDGVSYTTTGFNYVTGGTYSNNLLNLRTNTGGTVAININDVFVTGGTYTAGTTTFVNNTGGTFSVSGQTNASINPQTGTTYTLLSSDNGKTITMNNASGITLTVPTGLTIGYNAMIIQLGVGQVTVTPSGTTVNNRLSFNKTAGQYSTLSIISYATNLFVSSGDMTA